MLAVRWILNDDDDDDIYWYNNWSAQIGFHSFIPLIFN